MEITAQNRTAAARPTGSEAFAQESVGELQSPEGNPFSVLLGQLMTGQQTDMAMLLHGQQASARWQGKDVESLHRAAALLADLLGGAGLSPDQMAQIDAQYSAQGGSGLPMTGADAQAALWQTPFSQTVSDAAGTQEWQAMGNPSQSASDPRASAFSFGTAGSDSASSGDLMLGGSEFVHAVRMAQKLLSQEDSRLGASGAIDVESLQQAVDTGRYAQASAMNGEEAPIDPKQLLAQVETQIAQKMPNAKDGFTIRLKPDGLGEITVKLSTMDGKIAMSILTSSTQVAKLLGSELPGLSASLKPYHVETVEVSAQPAAETATQNGGLFQQHFGGHRQQPSDPGSHGSASDWWDDSTMEESALPAMNPNAALDTYI